MTSGEKPSKNGAAASPAKDPRLLFGRIAVENGFVHEQQIVECRRVQEQMVQMGVKPKKLGDLLVEKGFLSAAQVQEIFRLQGREGGHRHISGYKLLEKIGQGSMGLVFRAKQLSMDRIVAMKVLYPRLAKNQSFVERFLREARSSARLNHINIISGIDVGESNGIYYFAMEFVDGQTVQRILNRGGCLDEKRAISITMQIARAMEHAHKHAIIHRDVKPDNIMVASDGIAKLCDLGLARSTAKGSTEHGVTMGTPNYISPEQVRGDADIDGRTDIYALGGTFFHMLTGRPPYIGNAATVMAKHCSEPPPDARSVNSEVHPQTAQIALRMMAKNPDQRYQSMREIVHALEAALEVLDQRRAAPAAQPMAQPTGAAPAQVPLMPPRAQAPPQARPKGPRRRPRAGNVARRLRRR